MKIIALMPARNEAWILPQTLQSLSCFCDSIIVADQHSTDETRNICASFSKVQVIENEGKFHNNTVRWRLLEAARDFKGNNLLLSFDADEIPAAVILKPKLLQRWTELSPGQAIELQWIQLWRSTTHYRDDASVWSNSWKQFGFKDDRKVKYPDELVINDHTGRLPAGLNNIRYAEIPVLHFQFAYWERMLAKQNWYRASEWVNHGSVMDINLKYAISRDERNINLSMVPGEWKSGWQERNINLDGFQKEELFWYDIEVLRLFSEYGVKKFKELDIWDTDWENKRKISIQHEIGGIPDGPIHDPRTWEQKKYHDYLHKYINSPWWRSNLNKLHYFLNRIGITRKNLARLGVIRIKK